MLFILVVQRVLIHRLVVLLRITTLRFTLPMSLNLYIWLVVYSFNYYVLASALVILLYIYTFEFTSKVLCKTIFRQIVIMYYEMVVFGKHSSENIRAYWLSSPSFDIFFNI